MPTPDYPPDLGADLRDLRNMTRAALIAARSSVARTKIYAQTIDLLGRLVIKAGGKLVVENGAGNGLVYAGQILLNDASYADGFAVFRPGGEVALASFQSNSGWITVMYDLAGNRLIYPDEVAGQGLTRPWIPIPFTDNLTTSWAGVTAATFTNLYATAFYKQHARLRLWVRVITPVGVTAEVDLYDIDNATQLASFSVAAGANSGGELLGAISGAHMSVRNIAVRARVASGAGTVLVNVLSSYGRD